MKGNCLLPSRNVALERQGLHLSRPCGTFVRFGYSYRVGRLGKLALTSYLRLLREQLDQNGAFHRFGEMMIEAGAFRARNVLVLAPAGQRHQERAA